MISKPMLATLALAGVAVAGVGTYAYKRVQKEKSLRQGITQTHQSLNQVNQLLAENETELTELFSETLQEFSHESPITDVKDLYDVGKNSFDATKAVQDQSYIDAMGKTAEALAAIWGKLDPRVELGTKSIDAAAALYEAQSLIRAQQQLLQVQTALQLQLFRLEGKDPEALAQWQQILNNLYGDPAAQHAVFLEWLAAHGLSEKDVVAKALANAADAGPAIASQVASGITVIDPSPNIDALSDIPNINPDFIAGLKCEVDGMRDIMNGGNGSSGDMCPRCRAGDPCDRYPDGSYINAFGPPAYDPTASGASSGRNFDGLFRSRVSADSNTAADVQGLHGNSGMPSAGGKNILSGLGCQPVLREKPGSVSSGSPASSDLAGTWNLTMGVYPGEQALAEIRKHEPGRAFQVINDCPVIDAETATWNFARMADGKYCSQNLCFVRQSPGSYVNGVETFPCDYEVEDSVLRGACVDKVINGRIELTVGKKIGP